MRAGYAEVTFQKTRLVLSVTPIHDLLAEYARMARDTRQKGLLLERLTRAYLTADPVYIAMFDQVWLWDDWPGRDGKVDTGIDLVARERAGGGYCAIQCKFYDPSYAIQKGDIDSFFTASDKHPFTSRLVVSTTDKWSKHASDALVGQQIKTWRIGVDDLEQSGVDWSRYSLAKPDEIAQPKPKQLREHQIQALTDVETGFAGSERGKLIMACGTGKTFTSLRIAEKVAGAGDSVLFLVPSIALLSQTLKEWSAERSLPLRAFAICSDTKVGKDNEDGAETIPSMTRTSAQSAGRATALKTRVSSPSSPTAVSSTAIQQTGCVRA